MDIVSGGRMSLAGYGNRSTQLTHVSLIDGKDNTNLGLNTVTGNGSNNTIVGAFAGTGMDARSRDVVVIGARGAQALKHSTYSVAIGSGAAQLAQAVHRSVLIGTYSGRKLRNAQYCTAVGYGAAMNMVGGVRNTMVGSYSGSFTLDSADNTFVGDSAGALCRDGQNNVFMGSSSGRGLTTGDNNVFMGFGAGGNVARSDNSVAIGSLAMNSARGSVNMCIGSQTGALLEGSFNTLIGGNTATNAEVSNTTIIGNYMCNSDQRVTITDSVILGQNISIRSNTKPLSNMVIIGSGFELGNEHNESFLIRFGDQEYVRAGINGEEGIFFKWGNGTTVFQQILSTERVEANLYMQSPSYKIPYGAEYATLSCFGNDLILDGPVGANKTVRIRDKLKIPALTPNAFVFADQTGVLQSADLTFNSSQMRISTDAEVLIGNVLVLSNVTANSLVFADASRALRTLPATYDGSRVKLQTTLSLQGNTSNGSVLFSTATGDITASTLDVAALSGLLTNYVAGTFAGNVDVKGQFLSSKPTVSFGFTGGPLITQRAWDTPGTTHAITWTALVRSSENSSGMLYVHVSNKATIGKNGFACLSVMKTNPNALDALVVSLHKSSTLTTFTCTIAATQINVNTDSDCAVCYTFIAAV